MVLKNDIVVINMSSTTTVHVVGWPRWLRESVTAHPQCEHFGVEQVGSMDSIPSNCAIVQMENSASETEFRKILTSMNPNVTRVVFSEGIDRDGTVHDGEVVTFSRLGDIQVDEVTIHPVLYHFRRWSRITLDGPASFPVFPSPSQSSSSLQPSWLTEAQVRVETQVAADEHCEVHDAPVELESYKGKLPTPPHNVPPLLSDIPEYRTAPPPVTPIHSTYFNIDGTTVLTLDGVVTPAMIMSLAQPNTIVYLPTLDGIQTSLTRVRNAIWIGLYTVDLMSWNVEYRTYKLTGRTGRTQIAPRRTVAQIHRQRRRQFERR